jgi:hypothetical protein
MSGTMSDFEAFTIKVTGQDEAMLAALDDALGKALDRYVRDFDRAERSPDTTGEQIARSRELHSRARRALACAHGAVQQVIEGLSEFRAFDDKARAVLALPPRSTAQ